MSKNKYTPVDLPLEAVSEATVVGRGPFKKISIYPYKDKLPSRLARYEFKVHNPESWTLKIEEACSQLMPERAGATAECTVCGTQVKFSQTECPICGAQLT